MIDDAAAAAAGGGSSLTNPNVRAASASPACGECQQRAESLYAESLGEKSIQITNKSSAARRHFAKYEPQQLQQMNDEIELGWDCGIW